jgi:hypothetical protein
MRTTEIIEAYMRLLESETRIREAHIGLLAQAQTEMALGRRFVETLLRPRTEGMRARYPDRQFPSSGFAMGGRIPPPGLFVPPARNITNVSFEVPGQPDGLNSFDGLITSFLQSLATDSETDTPLRTAGITAQELESVSSTRLWTAENDSEALPHCTITLQPFEPGDTVRRLDVCGHEFGCRALARAMSVQATCPLCRRNVRAPQEMPQRTSGDRAG